MKSQEKKVINSLKAVLSINLDAKDGYTEAMDHVDDKDVKTFFQNKVYEREAFIEEIKEELSSYVVESSNVEEGNVAGAIHRMYMDLKATFLSDNVEAMFKESMKGEKAAMELYKSVLENDHLPQGSKIILRKQLQRIENDIKKYTKE